MQILLALSKEKIFQFNRINNIFSHFSDKKSEDAVAVVIENPNFTEELNNALGLNVPVVVIAGLEFTGQKYVKEARDCGVPDRCIILKNKENVISVDGYKYGQSPRGINVKMITDIATDVFKKGLFPEMLIWEEPAEILEPPETIIWEESYQSPEKQQKQKVPKKVLNEDLKTFLSKAKVVAVLKSVPSIDSSITSKQLAKKLNGIHLELNTDSQSFKQYADNKEDALQKFFAYSDGKTVEHSKTEFEWIIAEINPSMTDVIEVIYNEADSVIYVVGTLDESEISLDMWIEGGYKLNAIIPEQSCMGDYKEKYGNKVMELNHFTKQVN